jgi:elongation factor 3
MGNKIEGSTKKKKLTSAELRKKKKDRMVRRPNKYAQQT